MLWFVIRLIFKTSSVTPDFFYVFNLILSFSTCSQSFNKICAWEVLGANVLKDVRAHCYCASLVRTLYMTWHVPRHVFQARAPSRNSIKYRAGDLCGNLICEYFCWIIGDPHFFFRQITSFSDSFHYTKKQKKSGCGKFLIYYSNRAKLVHVYSCVSLRSCIF